MTPRIFSLIFLGISKISVFWKVAKQKLGVASELRQYRIELRQNNTLLEVRADYKPNETEYQIAALKARHDQLKATNLAAKQAYIAEANAREQRDAVLYDDETGILTLVQLIKTYIDYRFGKESAIYKQINALKFRRVE